MTQQEWANSLSDWQVRQIQGMQNAFAPKTHEERVEHNLRQVECELNEIKRQIRLNEKSRRVDFWVLSILSAISPFAFWLLLRLT